MIKYLGHIEAKNEAQRNIVASPVKEVVRSKSFHFHCLLLVQNTFSNIVNRYYDNANGNHYGIPSKVNTHPLKILFVFFIPWKAQPASFLVNLRNLWLFTATSNFYWSWCWQASQMTMVMITMITIPKYMLFCSKLIFANIQEEPLMVPIRQQW